jgi:Zn-dependent protease with chaperone function
LPSSASGQTISNGKLFGKSLEAAFQALEQFPAFDDPEQKERVANIGYRLAAQADFRDFPFSFYLIDMPEPNAFALPGGHIFVTRGMLGLGLDDDMLACLLGHEIAHVIERHGMRMKKRANLLNVLSQALLLGVLVGVDDNRDNSLDPYGVDRAPSRKGSLVQGAAATGIVVSELLLRNYSRDFEDEADVVGQRLAAAAGFDPLGANTLWELMNRRLPPSRKVGYWRTHPFSDQRMRAAKARAEELKILKPKPEQDYRVQTQKVLLGYRSEIKVDPKPLEKADASDPRHFLEQAALTAWPTGSESEGLRLGFLHRQREAELIKNELQRDYGALVKSYRAEIEEVRRLDPESAILAALEGQLEELRDAAKVLYPKALKVWNEEIYQTAFLETFLSNYPTVEEVPEVALALGNAYSRVGRQDDGVRQYLRAVEAGPESTAGQRALLGLRNLAPVLEQLAALERLTTEIEDPELARLATDRLVELAGTYKTLENGAEYLRRFPAGTHAGRIRERLEALAQNFYGEVVLYQGLGDHVKALERIQAILTHAPDTPAAESLRESAVLEG